MYKSIVVGTDGSSSARQAVSQATALAKLSGARLHIVSAYRPPSQTAAAAALAQGAAAPSVSDDEVRSAVEGLLQEVADEARSEGVEVDTYPCAGSAARSLVDVAENQSADLIVVGNQGMGGARRILGSVPNSVSHHAPCSVLIVATD